ncbi:phytase-like protein with esterase activity [Jatrophihabitans sp. GAS493]|uniref:esterase-like activity of phytase family protein n=1 Tax=Jatrophihabitans sp. GAS493 TaxID=1907575 RepID=UPI000BB97F5F|nr:esterase-like activity of phytase family protein [Jatrophihabitans sp. GAS493]SOD71421.1 phytase-like protein with esterase activity [Jatrophihabitans sp. GAS493]
MKRRAIALAVTGTFALTAVSVCAAASADAGKPDAALLAQSDAYLLSQDHTLKARASVLGNDQGGPTAIVSHTDPTHGTLTLNPDGTFSYVPAAGFSGVDSFDYTVSDAVTLYQTHLPPLATIGGVKITGGAYGSSLAPVPGSKNEVYGLTDRGPNVDGPNGTKIEPISSFDPAIGKFKLVNGSAVLEQTIPLKAGDGTPYNGLVNSQASTGETITDLDGNVLPTSPNGYDSEGLVALKDGTFWVSDEYGPFITHFDKHGKAIERLSPFDASLPAELAQRVPNKGMEGLTVTPDGKTLVGIMQSALQTPDLTKKPASVTTLRIVTYALKSHATHEYLYLLDDPKVNSGAVSEITALTNTTFVVDERDGKFEPNAYKKLFTIDLTNATDVGPKASVPGATYDATKGGLLVGANAQSIDAYVGTDDTATATADLAGVGITPVSKTLDVDLGGLLTRLDPTGGFFGHDKVEGVATTDQGKTLIVSNDNDFGISGVTGTSAPFTLAPKILPNGQQDDGEYLAIDTTKLNDPTSTATVSIFVTPPGIHH